MRQLAAHTWLLILIPLIAGILLCYYTSFPCNLLRHTQVDYLNRDTLLCLHILDEGQARTKTIRYTAQAEDGSQLLLYLQKDSLAFPTIGDVLLVQTTVQRGDTLGNFDYGKYLQMKGLVGSAWAHRGNWQIIAHRPIKGLRALAEKYQKQLHLTYQRMGIREPQLGILSALTLGYREELNREVQQSFSAAGAMHILAVSGLHTGIVWGIIIWILTLGGLVKPLYEQHTLKWIITSITLVALWAYAFITGLSPSVMRSALMLTIVEIGWLLQRNSNSINTLSAAAVIILLINPLALWDVSFQLSFVAVAALITIAKRMNQSIIVKGKIPQYITGLLLVSIAAQIGTIPISLYYFGQTSNYFALTNLVVIPAAFLLLTLGIGSLAFSWCIVGDWLASAADYCTYGLRVFVEWIESLPFSTTQLSLSAPSVFLCYGAIIAAALMMRGNKVHWGWLAGVVLCLGTTIIIECRIFN